MTTLTASSDSLREVARLLRGAALDPRGLAQAEVARLAGYIERAATAVLQIEVDLVAERCAREIVAEAAGMPLPRLIESGDDGTILAQLDTVCRTLQSAARRGEALTEPVSASLAMLVRSAIAKAERLVEAARERDQLRAIADDLDLATPPSARTGRRPPSRPIPIRERGDNVFLLPVIHRPIPPTMPPTDPDPRGAA
jgi:hypothetical protein